MYITCTGLSNFSNEINILVELFMYCTTTGIVLPVHEGTTIHVYLNKIILKLEND